MNVIKAFTTTKHVLLTYSLYVCVCVCVHVCVGAPLQAERLTADETWNTYMYERVLGMTECVENENMNSSLVVWPWVQGWSAPRTAPAAFFFFFFAC